MLSRQAIVVVVVFLVLFFVGGGSSRCEAETLETASLHVDYSVARRMPDTLFGLFFEEINHAGSGFEAGANTSNIDPWSIIGDESSVHVTTDRSSCFSQNPVAVRIEVVCDDCPAGGVGIYNPGFWGMGHGFRKELMYMLLDLKPRFLRFPGGRKLLVHGKRDLDTMEMSGTTGRMMALGMSHHDAVNGTMLAPFIKDATDSLEFAKGSDKSTWGSVRATMGHPEPFPLKYVALGNEDCAPFKLIYRENYPKFYNAIKEAYPDIQIISNCDGSSGPLDHPADLYDYHIYENASTVFLKKNEFDRTSRNGPKVFVSEYAVNGEDAGNGSLLASLAEAAFLIGLEKNSWNPDAIVFNSWQQYGTPSYWMQTYFRESSGAMIHPIMISSSYSDLLAASAITWQDAENTFLRVKIVNFGPNAVNLTISSSGLQAGVDTAKSTVTVLTSSNLLDENSFSEPNKNLEEGNFSITKIWSVTIRHAGGMPRICQVVVPVASELPNAAEQMQVLHLPYSICSFDLALV
uniref:non-reducing end alpha-L-arabinofuranosidase n=1 Tax=Oryza nivara TaxID=4536 RepID=A0A0E0J676_ORYNI